MACPSQDCEVTSDISTASVQIRTSNQLRIGLFNAQSSVKKALDIHDVIVEKFLDVLIITETWLREAGHEVVITPMTPRGFVFVNHPRQSKRLGGGIAIIFRKSLIVKLLSDETFTTFESMNFTITCGKPTLRVLRVYHPPYSETNSH